MHRCEASIFAASTHTLSISNHGEVYSFGQSYYYHHGFKETVFPPKVIPNLNNIKSISVGCFHTVSLDNDGNVFCFGHNFYGDALESTHIPQKVNIPPCKQVCCGNLFTICLSEDGLVYSFGFNGNGELGLGNNKNYNSPQLISSLKDVEFIECGELNTFCKTSNNEIFCWGQNFHGELGLGNRDCQKSPIQNLDLLNLGVMDIKCGYYHTLVLASNGDVLSCGKNEEGQLGRESEEYSSSIQKIEELPEITRIECGSHHSLCIDINNDLYVFGYNEHGQLGLRDTDSRNKPMKHPSLSNIIDISSGGLHTFVKTSNNEIYAFGKNNYLQLGIETAHYNQFTPIRVFEDNEDIWFSNINKSKAKSARSILPRPSNEEDNSPPKKKQKTK